MTSKSTDDIVEQRKSQSIVLKRSWFLFAIGLLLINWWPGDILHFYGGYLHIAAFLLFFPKKHYLWFAVGFIFVYNLLQFIIPITTAWDLRTTKYADFWTPIGFLRNTFYNGWNSIFPWFAFFLVGMYLGKINWANNKNQKKIFLIGLALLAVFKGLRWLIKADMENVERRSFYVKYWMQLMEDYFPANIPYIVITTGFALMVISTCVYLGGLFSNRQWMKLLSLTGEMTLTHYVFHITIGTLIFAKLTGTTYTGYPSTEQPVSPFYIIMYSIFWFLVSVTVSFFWRKKFSKGPLETIMRKVAG